MNIHMSDTKKTPTKVDSITRADINRKAKALYTVTKKNGLNPKSRKLGCPLTFKMFSDSELKQGFRLAAEVSCYPRGRLMVCWTGWMRIH